MAESTKLRLVRCPKCENLLPELADYSVYQCGGCGAVLRAKNKNQQIDTLSEKTDEERSGGASSGKSQNSLEKGIVDLSDASDTDVLSNTGSLKSEEKGPENNDVGFSQKQRNESQVTGENWTSENGLGMNMSRGEWVNKMRRENEELNSEFGSIGGSERPGQMSDWRGGMRREMDGFRRTSRADVEGLRYSTSKHLDEGPSSCYSDSSYGYQAPSRNYYDQEGANRGQYLDQDRAELLRKLDELKEQLSRSCDVIDKPKDQVPLDGRMVPPDPYGPADTCISNVSSGSEKVSMPFLGPGKHVAGPPYFHHRPDPFAYPSGHEVPMHGLYPLMNNPNCIPGYGDSYGSQMLRRTPHQLPSQYQQQPSHSYFSGQYVDTTHDSFEPYQQNSVFHQPSCSCFHCYNRQQRASMQIPTTTNFSNKRYNDAPYNPNLCHHENPGMFGPNIHNTRTSVPPALNFRGPQAHTRWAGDINSDMGGFVRCRPPRVVLASGARHSHPVAGGAPFLTCPDCFELLQLPKKLQVKKQLKLQCGACSTVINFAIINKKLVLSVNAAAKPTSTEVDDSSREVVEDQISHSHGFVKRLSVNFSSDDYDNSGYDFQSMDPVPLSTGQGLNSSKPQEMQSFHSSSPTASDDENSPDVLNAVRGVANSAQCPVKDTFSPPPRGSPLQEHFDYSSNNHAVNRFAKGNRSSRSDQEKVVPNKTAKRQNSMEDASLATEMDVSFNEYSNTGVSQDSGDTTREHDPPRTNKGGESFFANIIKKSFKDFARSNQAEDRGKSNVSVNRHPIPERVVKRAEKMAGPILPGQYCHSLKS
ncbi:protein ENHANCED DISEASE RESISTANCE 4-like isoform X2 [Carica papaya]|uniref:protein ENHANCED DISEASE RESISTANCE 4-like isoform X2 n=1 Tax=Carica papaya TaxID=3649 RepID=UPI000B8D119C|nr:protein ENHANCED DISEASE RESISTANCE 4-like isoform X2 [Carica papaya]